MDWHLAYRVALDVAIWLTGFYAGRSYEAWRIAREVRRWSDLYGEKQGRDDG